MNRFTKKYMTEDYERLYDHASLLDLHVFDTQTGAQPDAVEQYTDIEHGIDVRVQLWRATSATGGYVIVMQSIPNIWYLDDAIVRYRDNHSEHTLGLRICLERLSVKRNRMYSDSIGRELMQTEKVA